MKQSIHEKCNNLQDRRELSMIINTGFPCESGCYPGVVKLATIDTNLPFPKGVMLSAVEDAVMKIHKKEQLEKMSPRAREKAIQEMIVASES